MQLNFKNSFLLFALASLISGCSSSGSESAAQAYPGSAQSSFAATQGTDATPALEASIEVQGSAVKGTILQGIVSAYAVSSDTKSLTLLDTVRTDNLGNFRLDVPLRHLDNPVLLQVTADQHSQMRCEKLAGCINLINGNWSAYAETLPLSDNFQLLGVLAQDKNHIWHASVSGLSHLIVSTALNLPDGLTSKNTAQATQWVKDTLLLEQNPLITPIVDVTDPMALQSTNASSAMASLLNAGLYEIAQTQAWFDATVSINDLPLREVVASAAELALSYSHRWETSTQNQINKLTNKALAIQSDEGLSIIASPESMNVVEGQSFYFRVHAESDRPITYHWFRNGQAIINSNDAVFGSSSANLSDTGVYQVLVEDGVDAYFSSTAALTVNKAVAPVQITRQPASQTLLSGDTLALSIGVNQTGADIYWQRNGSVLLGQKGPSIIIRDVQSQDSGQYRAIVSDGRSTLYSDFAHVHVSDAHYPVKISSQPQHLHLVNGQTARFSVDASGAGFLRYQWYKDFAPISGATSASYTLANISKNDEGRFHVQVSNSAGTVLSSSASLNVVSDTASLELLEHPESRQIYIGQDYTLSVTAPDLTTYTYQWFKNSVALIGATDRTYTINSADLGDAGQYHAVVSSALGEHTSSTAIVEVRERPTMSLSWAMPSQRENGEPLLESEIFGYRIGWGTRPNSLSNIVDVAGALNTDYELDGLTHGLIYVHIATIDSDGVVGRFSDKVEVTIP